MKKRNITIHDIAKELKITASTVSRALNDHPRISKATKKAVFEVAKKLHYQPNNLASNLRRGKGKTIGVVVPRVNRHFFANVIGGIEEVADKEGFRVMICQSHESYEKEVKNIHALINAQVDGIIISLASNTQIFDHLKLVHDRGTPLLFFDRACEEINASSVIADNFKGAYEMTRKMIEGGCKRIIHFAGPLHLDIYTDRNEGYKSAMVDSGLRDLDKMIYSNILTQEEGRQTIESIHKRGIIFDGVFASSDFSALGAYLFLQDENMRIPEDISIAGFANEPFTSLMSPSISSVEQHSKKIGEEVARLFLKQYNSIDKISTERIVISPDVLIRESIKKM